MEAPEPNTHRWKSHYETLGEARLSLISAEPKRGVESFWGGGRKRASGQRGEEKKKACQIFRKKDIRKGRPFCI